MHGRLYIVLKESLRRIPVIGWGIQLSQFIFLKRNWEKDKPNLSKHLQKLNKITDPMWLLLFPEGTNLAPSTRESSKKWAEKNGIKDMQHTLLPRTTGLQFCLQELRRTVGYVYDCTIAYEGVPRGQYAQDIYTLQAQYVQGRSPKCVHMYWRRFRISDIPVDNEKSFASWLQARWVEKDAYIEYFYRTGKFPCDVGTTLMRDGSRRKGAGYIVTTIRATQWHEFLQVFIPIGLLSLVLYTFYNELPRQFMNAIKSGGEKAVVEQAESITSQFGSAPKTITTYPGGPTITINSDKVDPKQAAQLLQRTAKFMNKGKADSLSSALPQSAISSAQLPGLSSIKNATSVQGDRSAASNRSASISRAQSLASRRSSIVSRPATVSLASLRSDASSADWETMTNASIKSVPKLAPRALQKPLPNPKTAAQKPSLAAKPVAKKPTSNVNQNPSRPVPVQRNQVPGKTITPSINRPATTHAKPASKTTINAPATPSVKTATKPAVKPANKLTTKHIPVVSAAKSSPGKTTTLEPTPRVAAQKPKVGAKKATLPSKT